MSHSELSDLLLQNMAKKPHPSSEKASALRGWYPATAEQPSSRGLLLLARRCTEEA